MLMLLLWLRPALLTKVEEAGLTEGFGTPATDWSGAVTPPSEKMMSKAEEEELGA